MKKFLQNLTKELGLLAHQLLVLLKCMSPVVSYEISVSDHKIYIYIYTYINTYIYTYIYGVKKKSAQVAALSPSRIFLIKSAEKNLVQL